MNLSTLEKILVHHPAYRLKQAREAVFNQLVESWDEVSSLPLDLRTKLEQECPINIKHKIFESDESNTQKAIVYLHDGEQIETVFMQHKDKRNTLCVSSQVGCAMACEFCATGHQGFTRNLSEFEILEQVILFARILKKQNQKITNIVFMGMGEPLLNYDNVLEAIRIINSKEGFNIGARHISISTSGIREGIVRLTREPLQINLALSLNASNSKLRSEIMPINRQYPIDKIFLVLAEYIKVTRRRVMIEYVMLGRVNDTEKHARELSLLLDNKLGKLFFVNLINFNPTKYFKPSAKESIEKFKKILEKYHIPVTQRFAFGHNIHGACGQLTGSVK